MVVAWQFLRAGGRRFFPMEFSVTEFGVEAFLFAGLPHVDVLLVIPKTALFSCN
jgi:hypothetical protein